MKKDDSRKRIGIYGSTPIDALPLTTHNELKALVAISSFQGADEYAFPSMEKLALRADLSLSALSKAVTGLVRKELVSRKKRYGHSNIYYLLHKTESKEEIKAENKKVAAMQRARNKRKNSNHLNELDNQIKKLEQKISNPAKIKLSQEEFLNLLKSSADKMRAGSPHEKDALCRILFLNLRVDNEKVASYLWREPFASFLKATEFSSGRGDRI
jgi:DNA-binding MarR family transcriptional regulator